MRKLHQNVYKALFTFLFNIGFIVGYTQLAAGDSVFCGHPVSLDHQSKLLPWSVNQHNPYDYCLRLRWSFVLNKAPLSPQSSFPQYYFYCAFRDSGNILLPDNWMNDVGEKIPMWFESARLYYQYTGDTIPLTITKGMIDYSLEHGITSNDFSWTNFPQTAANAGATEFTGFTTANRFSENDAQVDHAGDMGATYFKMYLFYRDSKYKLAAIKTANTLSKKIREGNAQQSPWPYVVNLKTGKIVSEYGTNWFGCIRLFDMLIESNEGNVALYKKVREKIRQWILHYPVKNGNWVDGHTDTYITGTGNLSNLSASNAGLYISDVPGFDPHWKSTLPGLIKWTEKHFIEKSAPGEPSSFFEANLVSEQVAFMPKMDYQTARYAAQCARWFQYSGDSSFKEKAFRAINFVTYCNDTAGKVYESPFSKGVNSWWSDSYGEGPSMFYPVLASLPELAPLRENHLLYSTGILRDVLYSDGRVNYVAAQGKGIEYLRIAFKPVKVSINAVSLPQKKNSIENSSGYVLSDLGNGDYALIVKRNGGGNIVIAGNSK